MTETLEKKLAMPDALVIAIKVYVSCLIIARLVLPFLCLLDAESYAFIDDR